MPFSYLALKALIFLLSPSVSSLGTPRENHFRNLETVPTFFACSLIGISIIADERKPFAGKRIITTWNWEMVWFYRSWVARRINAMNSLRSYVETATGRACGTGWRISIHRVFLFSVSDYTTTLWFINAFSRNVYDGDILHNREQ